MNKDQIKKHHATTHDAFKIWKTNQKSNLCRGGCKYNVKDVIKLHKLIKKV